ncbi:hypothetical protein J1N35_030535 [Gossypium stocksii]|uniref:Reverse transcriptase domain-containing protein n=1 Tax=Gossypium stocksii TaxID=47602 RepID=A0A9D3V063_9ROSI|nr:hypothetical protein J1N35_030535 [Gossypium stocksii]
MFAQKAYFLKTRNIVGDDVTAAVLEFFQVNNLLPAFNSTLVALVPKKLNSSCMKDFRPISCCSVIYKCITRILIDRLTSFLPKLNVGNQSAFIHGRNISHNILLAQEMVRGYGRKSLSPRCAMKIDLQKAYNFLNWDFIFATLEALGFPLLFIRWIGSCVTQPRYSISFNGGLVGYFKDAKGTRQGDPL